MKFSSFTMGAAVVMSLLGSGALAMERPDVTFKARRSKVWDVSIWAVGDGKAADSMPQSSIPRTISISTPSAASTA